MGGLAGRSDDFEHLALLEGADGVDDCRLTKAANLFYAADPGVGETCFVGAPRNVAVNAELGWG